MKPILLFILLLLSYSAAKAGEMKFLWSVPVDQGYFYDLEFMPDNDYFVLGYKDRIELRETDTGNLIRVDSVTANEIEISSDSTKLYINCINSFQVRDVNSFDVLQSVILPDSIDGYPAYYSAFCVDPVRQLIYIKRAIKYDEDINGNALIWLSICIYNSETFEFITELTTEVQKLLRLSIMDISNDGKYLALITENKSKLMVWDLDTREQIVDHLMAPDFSTEWGEPRDLKFSKINTEYIYITGSFKHNKNDKDHQGLSVYSISQKQIIDERFSQQGNQFGPAMLSFLNNENHILATVSAITRILDMHNGVFLYETIQSKNFNWGYNRYSKKKDIIIGHGYNSFSAGFYDFDSSVDDPSGDNAIYPNPTTNEVNIPFTCTSPESTISLFDINGNNLTYQIHWQYTGEMYSIDLSGITAGVYLVRINCDGSSTDYRVVKEN